MGPRPILFAGSLSHRDDEDVDRLGRTRVRVAIDGRRLQDPVPGGVARWIAGILPYLADAVDLVVLTDARYPDPQLDVEVKMVPLDAPRAVPSLGWLELAARRWLHRFDGIFHGPFYAIPFAFRGVGVVTLHDLAPQTHPEDFGPAKRALWRAYARSSVKRARAIITVSAFMKSAIVDYYAINSERVTVAPNAPDARFSPELTRAGRAVAERLGVKGRYILALGGAPRRALPVAVQAWRRASRVLRDPPAMVVVGERSVASEPGLVVAPHLGDVEWAALLAGAEVFCYPTRYEGYGLPAIEAAASGTPVVCARVCSLPEVLGDAAAWCEAPTPEAVAEALVRLLDGRPYYDEVREAGLARAKAAPTWKDAAVAVLQAYDQAILADSRSS